MASAWPDEVPDPQDRATFERSKLNWDERERDCHAEMLDWYRSLIRMRRSTPELRDGNLDSIEVEFSEREQWLLIKRGRLRIVFNFSAQEWMPPLQQGEEILVASSNDVTQNGEALPVPPETVVILRARHQAARCDQPLEAALGSRA